VVTRVYGLPANATLQIEVLCNNVTWGSWSVPTADQASGDAQGQFSFLKPEGGPAPLFMFIGLEALFGPPQPSEEREVTIFDLDGRQAPATFAGHGFELDRSGSLNVQLRAFRDVVDELSEQKESGFTWKFVDENGTETFGRSVANATKAIQMRAPLILATAGDDDDILQADLRVSKKFTEHVASQMRREGGRSSELVEWVGLDEAFLRKATHSLRDVLVAQEKAAVEWYRGGVRQAVLANLGTPAGDDDEVTAWCYNMAYRSTAGQNGAGTTLPRAHIDADDVSDITPLILEPASIARGERLTGLSGEDLLKHAVIAFNAWVNTGDDPIEEFPLAVCDTQTLDPADLGPLTIQPGLSSQGVRWSKDQRWFYSPVGFGEGYRFRTFPE